jgi:hypothetical protein
MLTGGRIGVVEIPRHNICDTGWHSTVIGVLDKQWEQQLCLKQLMPVDANPNSAEIEPRQYAAIIIIILIIIIT